MLAPYLAFAEQCSALGLVFRSQIPNRSFYQTNLARKSLAPGNRKYFACTLCVYELWRQACNVARAWYD